MRSAKTGIGDAYFGEQQGHFSNGQIGSVQVAARIPVLRKIGSSPNGHLPRLMWHLLAPKGNTAGRGEGGRRMRGQKLALHSIGQGTLPRPNGQTVLPEDV